MKRCGDKSVKPKYYLTGLFRKKSNLGEEKMNQTKNHLVKGLNSTKVN